MMNSLLIIIVTAAIGSAVPVPLTIVSRYTTPGELDWYEDGSEDFLATVQIGNDVDQWEATLSDYDGSEVMQALYEDDWIPEDVVVGGGGEEVLVGAASGARGFHMRQEAWRRGVRAYDPHHWNSLPRAHRTPHRAEETVVELHTAPEATANPMGGASE